MATNLHVSNDDGLIHERVWFSLKSSLELHFDWTWAVIKVKRAIWLAEWLTKLSQPVSRELAFIQYVRKADCCWLLMTFDDFHQLALEPNLRERDLACLIGSIGDFNMVKPHICRQVSAPTEDVNLGERWLFCWLQVDKLGRRICMPIRGGEFNPTRSHECVHLEQELYSNSLGWTGVKKLVRHLQTPTNKQSNQGYYIAQFRPTIVRHSCRSRCPSGRLDWFVSPL